MPLFQPFKAAPRPAATPDFINAEISQYNADMARQKYKNDVRAQTQGGVLNAYKGYEEMTGHDPVGDFLKRKFASSAAPAVATPTMGANLAANLAAPTAGSGMAASLAAPSAGSGIAASLAAPSVGSGVVAPLALPPAATAPLGAGLAGTGTAGGASGLMSVLGPVGIAAALYSLLR